MPSVAILGTRGYPSYYGGFETAVRALAPYLAESGWEVTVYGRKSAIKFDDSTLDSRVHSVTTPGLNSTSLSTLSHGLTSICHAATKKPDVALIMNVANGFFLPLLRARGVPTLVNVDGIEWERDKWGKAAKSVFHAGARMTAKYADELVFDAEAIGNYWQSNFGRGGTFIPYGGLERSEMLPIDSSLQHRKYVLTVARFVPENSIKEFFDAVRIFGREIPTVIVGSTGFGGEFDTLAENLANELPLVQWLGHVSDDEHLHSLWQHAALYFHGHSVGGTNPALVQAMALGAPTIARDTIYNREVLGDTGTFTDPSPQAIADSVVALFDQPERLEQMSFAAQARARSKYSWTQVNKSYESALTNLLK